MSPCCRTHRGITSHWGYPRKRSSPGQWGAPARRFSRLLRLDGYPQTSQQATRRRILLYEPAHARWFFRPIAIAGLNFLEIVETMIHTPASNFIAAFVFVVFYNFIYFFVFNLVVGARRTAVGCCPLRGRWAGRQCRGPVPTRTSHRGRPGRVRRACESASRSPRRGGGQGR